MRIERKGWEGVHLLPTGSFLLSRSETMDCIPGDVEQIVQGLTASQQHTLSVQGASRLLEARFTAGTGSR